MDDDCYMSREALQQLGNKFGRYQFPFLRANFASVCGLFSAYIQPS